MLKDSSVILMSILFELSRKMGSFDPPYTTLYCYIMAGNRQQSRFIAWLITGNV